MFIVTLALSVAAQLFLGVLGVLVMFEYIAGLLMEDLVGDGHLQLPMGCDGCVPSRSHCQWLTLACPAEKYILLLLINIIT